MQAVAGQDMCAHGSDGFSFSCCSLHERQIGGHNLRQVPEFIQGNCLTRGGHLLPSVTYGLSVVYLISRGYTDPTHPDPALYWILPGWKFMLLPFLLPPEVAFLIVSLRVACHKNLILNVLNTQ